MSRKSILAAVIFLVACTPSAKDLSGEFTVLPEGMKDCKVYRLKSTGGSSITAIRCPNSATTSKYPSGKTTNETVVVEREERPQAVEERQQVVEVKPAEITVDGVTYRKVD